MGCILACRYRCICRCCQLCREHWAGDCPLLLLHLQWNLLLLQRLLLLLLLALQDGFEHVKPVAAAGCGSAGHCCCWWRCRRCC
jgi:hypothetical protein